MRPFAAVLLVAAGLAHLEAEPAGQTPVFRSPRLAAVAFAIKNGFEIPRANLVVAHEIDFGALRDRPRVPTDRRDTLSRDEILRDAADIAQLLGPGVTTSATTTLVTCTPRPCFASGATIVLGVDELKNNETAVLIRLFTPSTTTERAAMTQAAVDTSRQQAGWIATRFTRPPQKLFVR